MKIYRGFNTVILERIGIRSYFGAYFESAIEMNEILLYFMSVAIRAW